MRLQESPTWPQDGPRWPQDSAKSSQDSTNMAPRGPQGGSRWLKMAQEEPKRAPRGLQEGPQEGSKRDLGTNLAQRALRKSPGTLPDPSGERFWDRFGHSKQTPGGQNRTTMRDLASEALRRQHESLHMAHRTCHFWGRGRHSRDANCK